MRLEDVDFINGAMLGAVRLRGHWRLFTGFVAEWIMDYYAYDPTSNPVSPGHEDRLDQQCDDAGEFRDGLYQIDETNADAFCRAMEPWAVSPSDLRQWLLTLDEGTRWLGNLNVVIDFDDKVFVNGFSEQSIERYVPAGWRGLEADPLKYLPDDMKSWWGT